MITDVLVSRTEGDITIRTATEADRDAYIEFQINTDLMKEVQKAGEEENVDLAEIIWGERYKTDCIMFVIIENTSGAIIGFCEIEHLQTNEPTLGIDIAPPFRKKGYGTSAAKAMLALGWELFNHDYFLWELDQENHASRRIALKLGGQRLENRQVIPDRVIKMMQDAGIEFSEAFDPTVERYKIERPKN